MGNPYKCFFCEDEASMIVFYSKYYPFSDRDTIENPSFCCPKCWANGTARQKLFYPRGGREGILKFLFEDISKWDKKTVGWHLSKKGYEINHLANKTWRKFLWHIHYSCKQARRIDDAPSKCIGISPEA